MKRNIFFLLPLVLLACTAGPNPSLHAPDPAGFWLGLWHGMISPLTFIVSLVTDDVSIYEVVNNGGWYDWGFMLGLGAGASSARVSSRSTRNRR